MAQCAVSIRCWFDGGGASAPQLSIFIPLFFPLLFLVFRTTYHGRRIVHSQVDGVMVASIRGTRYCEAKGTRDGTNAAAQPERAGAFSPAKILDKLNSTQACPDE